MHDENDKTVNGTDNNNPETTGNTSAPENNTAPGYNGNPQNSYQPYQQNNYQPYSQNNYQPYSPNMSQYADILPRQKRSKKHLAWIIPVAVVGFITLLVFVVTIVKKANDDTPSVPYTKGTVVDGVYENEWADIRLEIPSGWKINKSKYSEYEDERTEVGLLLEDSYGSTFIISFEEIKGIGVSETAYINSVESQIKDEAKIGSTILISTDKGYETISGISYRYLKCKYLYMISDIYGEVYVKIRGKRATVITITGADITRVNDIKKCIKNVEHTSVSDTVLTTE